jgi:hypothetical protein
MYKFSIAFKIIALYNDVVFYFDKFQLEICILFAFLKYKKAYQINFQVFSMNKRYFIYFLFLDVLSKDV